MLSTLSHDRWRRLADAGIVQGDPPADDAIAVSWTIGAMLGGAAWLAALFLLFFLGLALEELVKRPAGAMRSGSGSSPDRWSRCGGPASGSSSNSSHWPSALWPGASARGLLMNDARPDALSWCLFAVLELGWWRGRVSGTPCARDARRGAFAADGVAHDLDASLFFPLLLAAFGPWRRASAAAPPIRCGRASRPALRWRCSRQWCTQRCPSCGRSEAGTLACGIAHGLGGLARRRLRSRRAAARARCRACRTLACRLGAALALGAVAIAAYPVPGVAAALVMLLMAFAAGQRALLGLAVIALLAALAHHYYRLDATLLQKSASLAAIGAVLLGARFAMLRGFTDEGRADA